MVLNCVLVDFFFFYLFIVEVYFCGLKYLNKFKKCDMLFFIFMVWECLVCWCICVEYVNCNYFCIVNLELIFKFGKIFVVFYLYCVCFWMILFCFLIGLGNKWVLVGVLRWCVVMLCVLIMRIFFYFV